ncbi:MAG: hypothetical protein J6Q94_01730 [Clostridia bacterium]|nr:hypothetical protein [Clostridia bacterium]
MKIRKLTAVFMAVVMLFTVLSCSLSAYALVMAETQYMYDSPNLSWLKDLIVKENMSSVDGLSQRNTIVAKAQYPYSATAETFKEEVASYQAIYTLDEDMANVLYLYMLELTMSFANGTDKSYSDEFIRAYLESLGIVYPSEDTQETKLIARALFTIVTKDEDFVVKRGTGLYQAFTSYISQTLGLNVDLVIRFDKDSDVNDLKDYVLAAGKYMLYSAGYNVTSDTPEEEVYRLIAIMTIRAQGISIDSSTATFEEIKNKYLCAIMCRIYEVTIDPDGFDKAVKKDNLAFYLLQLIGKEYGVTVRDSVSYETAFDIVSQNTTYFNLEEGEFYADVYEYDVQLNYKRDTIWLYPQTIGVTSESDGTKVDVFVNDNDVRENYYVSVAIDKEAEMIPLVITVEYTDKTGAKISSSYKLNVYQGKKESVQGSTISDAFGSMTDFVDKVLGDMGMDSSFADIISKVPFEIPQRILSITTLLLPEFDGNSLGIGAFFSQLFGYSKDNDSNVNTENIGGVGGLDTFGQSGNSTQSMDFGNLNIGNIGFNTGNGMPDMKPADTVILPDDGNKYPTETPVTDTGNWFTDLFSNTTSVILFSVSLVVIFGACLGLFMKFFGAKNNKQKKK